MRPINPLLPPTQPWHWPRMILGAMVVLGGVVLAGYDVYQRLAG